MVERSYNDALDILYSFINYELKRQDRYSPEVMTLDRPHELLALMGNPHRRYPSIHITGTKGKGSVGAMCKTVLQANGLKVGLYSSPHLQDFRERFQINNTMISREKLTEIVYDIKPHLDIVEGLTWFEVTTAVAFEYFAREQVDLAVIEVGLGGRLDATNVITPLVSVITSLSYDHMHLLGNTLAAIAGEKAGIIKPGVPVVSAPQEDEAQAVLARVAAERHAPLTVVGRDVEFHPHPMSLDEQRVTLRENEREFVYITNMIGEHQAINMAVAVTALRQLAAHGFSLSEDVIQLGLQQVKWPGRLEVLPEKPTIVLDVAHNRASAAWLRRALTALFSARPLALVFGAKGDKDIAGMMDELLPMTDHLILTQAVDSRAESLETLIQIAQVAGYKGEITAVPNVGEAVRVANRIAGVEGLVCVTGSLYVVGEARTELGLLPEEVMIAGTRVNLTS